MGGSLFGLECSVHFIYPISWFFFSFIHADTSELYDLVIIYEKGFIAVYDFT